MSQDTLFPGSETPPITQPARPERRNHHVQTRRPAVEFGLPDKHGKFWWERFRDEVRELPVEEQDAILEILLEWPAERTDKVRLLFDRWHKAQPAERDNFAEAFGK